MMAAIARSRPQPLVRNVMVSTQRKYQYVRLKETLAAAMGGIRGRGLFAVGDAGHRESISVADGEAGGKQFFFLSSSLREDPDTA